MLALTVCADRSPHRPCAGQPTTNWSTEVRKLIAGVVAGVLAVGLSACGSGGGSDSGKGTVGVAMPTKSSERWIADGKNIKSQLEKAGYKVDLQYAEDDIPTQVSQVEN